MILLLFFQLVMAKPAQIILIRHAEKPDYKSENLSPQGFLRADALANIFERQPFIKQFGNADFIFSTKYVPGKSSHRSFQTVEPLSKKLSLQINNQYLTEEYKSLAHELLTNPIYDNKSVFVAWTHSYLVQFADQLGSAPARKWNSSIFDRMWVIRFQNDGRAISYDLPQQLLPGDSDN